MIPKSSHNSFYISVRFYKIAQKVGILLGFFCYKFCHQEFSKIAQSGHPVPAKTCRVFILTIQKQKRMSERERKIEGKLMRDSRTSLLV